MPTAAVAELLFPLPFAMSCQCRTSRLTGQLLYGWRSRHGGRGAIAVAASPAPPSTGRTLGATALGLFAWSTLWMYIAVQIIAAPPPGLPSGSSPRG